MSNLKTDLLVLGSGPGGYSAAFRAADLGLNVVLVEQYDTLGGVCLNVGCIPSKALLHGAKIIEDANSMQAHGIEFGKAKIDTNKLRDYKNSVIKKLTGGLAMMAKQRKVTIVTGVGTFASPNTLNVKNKDGSESVIEFKNAIIAAGSRVVNLPFLPKDDRIFDSTGALEMQHTKGNLLVIGGGIIGLEMACVYHALGTKVSIVELADGLIPGADRDIVKPLQKWVESRYEKIMLGTKVTKVEATAKGLLVTFEGAAAPEKPVLFDQILSAVGRRPNGDLIAADKAGVKVDQRGFIAVDNQQRTNVPHIYAIGDICGNPMLAHKAVPEGRLAAEIISGLKHFNDVKAIPSVAHTDPEIAWVGLTETQAKEKGIAIEKGVFPWMASGRALSMGRPEGLTKLIFEPGTHRVLGGAVVGVNAGELIAEVTLAIEMGCDVEDIALTSHPHPTLSESVMLAAEVFEGTITDLYLPKKKENKEIVPSE